MSEATEKEFTIQAIFWYAEYIINPQHWGIPVQIGHPEFITQKHHIWILSERALNKKLN